jgi:hypothetical protein
MAERDGFEPSRLFRMGRGAVGITLAIAAGP